MLCLCHMCSSYNFNNNPDLDHVRMPVENEEKTVEVRGLPEEVDKELLSLYFTNKRRSGGGPLVSVEKKGDHAFLVFEEAEGKWRSTFI